MTDNQLDQWMENQLIQWEIYQEKIEDKQLQEEEEIEEESIFYASNPYTTKGAHWKQCREAYPADFVFKVPSDEEFLERFMYNKATHD